VDAVSEFNVGLCDRRAIYVRYPQAVPLAYTIDRDKCIGCGLCKNLCLADAINYEDKEEKINLKVGSIILTPGFNKFNPRIKKEYGYTKYLNVITSIEFERILSASGPYKGHVFRPSDGNIPQRIAFIQCVGSRDTIPEIDAPYCSAVCCMHAIKEAIIAKEHVKSTEPTVFLWIFVPMERILTNITKEQSMNMV